mmetsp:Transcript_1633/g.3444  ORF Transcript_1633/g.3444 Transcript_1633/m.3444 type:complete len:113 (+) Transcript_1633:2285-2623(+)
MRIERERREELIERAFMSMSGRKLTLGNHLSDENPEAMLDEVASRLEYGGPLTLELQEERREISMAAKNCASLERDYSRPKLPQSRSKSSFNFPRAGSSSSLAAEIGGPVPV